MSKKEIQELCGIKIINGSGKLLNQDFVEITSEKISFGEDPMKLFLFSKIYKILLLLIFFAISSGLLDHDGYIYATLTFVFIFATVALFRIFKIKDKRMIYILLLLIFFAISSGLLDYDRYIYVFISATITLFCIFKIYYSSPPKDKRMIYQSSDIEAFQIDYNNGNNVVANKSMGGSLAGAAVGGALFGGFGAVVGANASGNNIVKINYDTATTTIRFVDGEWVVMILMENFDIKKILKLADSKNICPI